MEKPLGMGESYHTHTYIHLQHTGCRTKMQGLSVKDAWHAMATFPRMLPLFQPSRSGSSSSVSSGAAAVDTARAWISSMGKVTSLGDWYFLSCSRETAVSQMCGWACAHTSVRTEDGGATKSPGHAFLCGYTGKWMTVCSCVSNHPSATHQFPLSLENAPALSRRVFSGCLLEDGYFQHACHKNAPGVWQPKSHRCHLGIGSLLSCPKRSSVHQKGGFW